MDKRRSTPGKATAGARGTTGVAGRWQRVGMLRAGVATVGLVLAALALGVADAGATVNLPFGSRPMPYAVGSIAPSHVSQATLDDAVRDFYDEWKAAYLAPACGPGRSVVLSAIDSGNLTVSEAHGYGMMLVALMAGYDVDAQEIFDGMYAYFLDHPTATHDRLMSWYQKKSCGDANGNDSATDGDLDVAFALLLADRQWGSCGAVDYAAEAAAVLADIADGELDASESWPLLGDWVTPGDSTYYPSTRASDLLTDHFRSFAAAAPAGPWSGLLDSVYDVMNAVVAGHAASTGLLPDFIVDPGGSPAPAPEFFLEGTTDGAWAYNACRVPWRLGTDYLVSGDARAKALVDDITDFYRAATGDDPSGIGAGYELDGTPSAGADYLSMAFVAPAGVGAMAEAANQTWLNDVWDVVAGTPLAAEGYYENTLKLLSMLVMAGHWWAPQAVGAPSCAPETTTLCTNPGRLLGAGISLKKLDRGAGEQQMAVTADLFFPIGAERNAEDGLQILVEDAGDGDAAIFELSTRTAAVPGDGEPTCNSRDGWKVKPTKVQYRNRSGAVDAPTCTEGSANGLAKLQYRASAPRDFYLKLKTKRSTIASPVGPVRLTVILGDDAGAGDAACAVSELLECSGDASSLYCE